MTGNNFPEVTFDHRAATFNSGQVLANTHPSDACLGEFCPLHNPSDHELRGENLSFNGKHMVREVNSELFIDPDDYYFNKYGSAILRNSAKCALCGDQIVSSHRHDFVSCECGEIFVDGGLDYLRRGANNLENIIETSITVGDIDAN